MTRKVLLTSVIQLEVWTWDTDVGFRVTKDTSLNSGRP